MIQFRLSSVSDWGDVARAVKRRRLEQRISQRAAAELAEVSPTTWGSVEKHARPIDERTRVRIAQALGWTTDSIDRILRGEPPQTLEAAHDEALRTVSEADLEWMSEQNSTARDVVEHARAHLADINRQIALVEARGIRVPEGEDAQFNLAPADGARLGTVGRARAREALKEEIVMLLDAAPTAYMPPVIGLLAWLDAREALLPFMAEGPLQAEWRRHAPSLESFLDDLPPSHRIFDEAEAIWLEANRAFNEENDERIQELVDQGWPSVETMAPAPPGDLRTNVLFELGQAAVRAGMPVQDFVAVIRGEPIPPPKPYYRRRDVRDDIIDKMRADAIARGEIPPDRGGDGQPD